MMGTLRFAHPTNPHRQTEEMEMGCGASHTATADAARSAALHLRPIQLKIGSPMLDLPYSPHVETWLFKAGNQEID